MLQQVTQADVGVMHVFFTTTCCVTVLSKVIKLTSMGTSFPSFMICSHCCPSSEPDLTSSRNRSPADKCVWPYFATIFSHWVPLPLPGPPSTNVICTSSGNLSPCKQRASGGLEPASSQSWSIQAAAEVAAALYTHNHCLFDMTSCKHRLKAADAETVTGTGCRRERAVALVLLLTSAVLAAAGAVLAPASSFLPFFLSTSF